MNNGFILIHRKITNWEWYSDTNVFCAFLHCIFLANWEDKKWRGITIKRGQFFTSIDSFSAGSGLSARQTRTAFDKLKSTNEITIQTTSNGTMVTVCKYDDYQDIKKATDKRTTSKSTNERQADDKRATTTNTLEELETIEEKYLRYIKLFNETAKKNYRGDVASKRQFTARINEGFTVEEMIASLKSAMVDSYHISTNFKYLTTEFFTRGDKIQKFLNTTPVEQSSLLSKFKNQEVISHEDFYGTNR